MLHVNIYCAYTSIELVLQYIESIISCIVLLSASHVFRVKNPI